MKTIGLIGGMSWESTLPYYRIINETVRDRLGSLHSAEILLHSVDFNQIAKLQHAQKWRAAGEILARIATNLERAGAESIVLCTNTMHKVAGAIESAVHVPFLHIVDATAEEILRCGLTRVGLLATRFTMEEDFYRERMVAHGIELLLPSEADRSAIHRIIYDELCIGRTEAPSRQTFSRVILDLEAAGAQGIILGCTEISLLIGQQHIRVPAFDSTFLHARFAADFSLGGRPS
jgi:aspartate racemase